MRVDITEERNKLPCGFFCDPVDKFGERESALLEPRNSEQRRDAPTVDADELDARTLTRPTRETLHKLWWCQFADNSGDGDIQCPSLTQSRLDDVLDVEDGEDAF